MDVSIVAKQRWKRREFDEGHGEGKTEGGRIGNTELSGWMHLVREEWPLQRCSRDIISWPSGYRGVGGRARGLGPRIAPPHPSSLRRDISM